MNFYSLKKILSVLGIIVILLTIATSCTKHSNYSGYKITDSGIDYNIITKSKDTSTVKISDFITLEIEYKTMFDSSFFWARRKLQVEKSDYIGSIDECFTMMNIGDSISFILDAKDFFNKTLLIKLPSFLQDTSKMIVGLKLTNIQNKEEFEKDKLEFFCWINNFADYEKIVLKHFFEEKDITIKPSWSGLYCMKTHTTTGIKVQSGDTVTVHYVGQYLNGKVFDSTRKRKAAFEFVFGREWQVVKGLEEAISMLREGEKAIFIMPSKLAFGEKGSSSGIIPPSTSIIYRVELIKIGKNPKNLKL